MKLAIDGPGGAGKSTVAKKIAAKLGILYLDTGAMYRAVAYYVRSHGVDPADVDGVEALLGRLELGVTYRGGNQIVTVCGQDVTAYIRTQSVGMDASTVSKIPAVRLKLVEIQREIAHTCDCVLDGRDIASFVLPDADLKIFLTASPEERARRRKAELDAKGQCVPYEQVLAEINARDEQDTNRSFAPLRCVEDAVKIDTTLMSVEEVCDRIESLIQARTCK